MPPAWWINLFHYNFVMTLWIWKLSERNSLQRIQFIEVVKNFSCYFYPIRARSHMCIRSSSKHRLHFIHAWLTPLRPETKSIYTFFFLRKVLLYPHSIALSRRREKNYGPSSIKYIIWVNAICRMSSFISIKAGVLKSKSDRIAWSKWWCPVYGHSHLIQSDSQVNSAL